MIRICNRKSKEVRINNIINIVPTNIKHYGLYMIMHHNKIQSKVIKEVIRIVDIIETENKYNKDKYQDKFNFLDLEA